MMTNQTNIKRPLLRYHGGKYRLAPWIISHFPASYWNYSYCEPYAGAASILFQKVRSGFEVINDLSGEVFNLYQVLRSKSQSKELHRLLNLTPYSFREYGLSLEPSDEPIEQARRTIVRHMQGVNSSERLLSGFRKNYSSKTTPSTQWGNYKKWIPAFTERMQGVHVDNRPAIDLMEGFDRDNMLFYVDPPYVFETRGSYAGRAYDHEMSDRQHIELAECLNNLKGMVILSGYRCDLYDDLYADWVRVDKNSSVDRGGKKIESIWINQACQDARGIKTLF